MAEPDLDALADVLRTQHQSLNDLLFRTLKLSMLTDTGEHRFLGWAIDEIEDAERQVAELEIVRASMVESLLGTPPGVEPTLQAVVDAHAGPEGMILADLGRSLSVITEEIEAIKLSACVRAGQRAQAASSAVSTVSAEAGTYSPPHGVG